MSNHGFILNFVDEWEGGGIYKRRHLNKYRKVYRGENDEETYIEINLSRDPDIEDIAKCSLEDLYLVQQHSWVAPLINNTARYLRTSVRQDGQSKTLAFARLILEDPDGHVTYINEDTLDNRRENLKIIKGKVKEEMNFINEPVDKETIKKSLTPGVNSDWEIGLFGGSVNKARDNGLVVRFQSPYLSKTFNFNKYGGEFSSKISAEEFRQEEAISRGLVWNKHRTCTTPEGDVYIEVQVLHKGEEMSFYCDVEDIDLLKKYKWNIRQRSNSPCLEVATSADKHQRFHTELGLYKIVDHIDGNPLNNRRCNLRDGSIHNARNYPKREDNSSGMTGVSFNNSKNSYVVQYPEGGKRKCKYFAVIKGKRTKAEALELAKDFRLEIDEKFNLHVQQHL